MRLPPLTLACLLLPGIAGAASFTVNVAVDLPDATPGNGVCNPLGLGPGLCTLRAAIMEANALAGSDSITLTAGQTHVLTRAAQDDTAVSGDLDINGNLSIVFFASGVRPVVDAGVAERAFEVNSGNVIMLGFDITGGDAVVPGAAGGGGIAVNLAAGTVQLSLLRLYGNTACFGGGLYNDGTATTVSASEFFDNERDGANCTPSPGGAAVHNRGTLVLEDSSLHGNDGTALVTSPSSVGVLFPASLLVSNTTISGNLGGGINADNDNNLVDQATTLRNTTIAGNTGTGLRIGGVETSLFLRNTIIARNNVGGAVGDCQLSQAASASYSTDRYNLDSDGTCGLAAGGSNLSDTDPRLTPLKNRGGINPVHWPRPDSAVIDRGHPTIGAIGCEPEDQHFVERPQDFGSAPDNNCDIGSVELPAESIFFDSHEIL
jgi:CSLREA domain-containing protein